jgi:hypothetical protein
MIDKPSTIEVKPVEDTHKTVMLRIVANLYKEIPILVAEYKIQVKHTGGLLSTSMSFAYAKGLSDAIKQIQKEIK